MIRDESREWRTLPVALKEIIQRFQGGGRVDLGGLARALGVPVKAATLAPGVSGEIRPDGRGGYIIRVNRHEPPWRQRFTVAHELSHFLLHRDQIGNGIKDDVLYRSGLSSKVEAEANRLAADVLMPTDAVARAVRTAQALAIEDVTAAVAQKFGVSEAAMEIKLGG